MTQYVAKNRTVRIPPITELQINSFNTGVVSVRGSYILNGVARKYPGGSYYITQRPGIDVFGSPSDYSVTDILGRGIYYWAAIPALYFVNADTIYQTDYSGPLTSLITTSDKPVNIAELGTRLVFLDSDNNEMWYIDSAVSATVVKSMNAFALSRTDISFTATSTIATVAGDFTDLAPGDLITVGSTSGTNDGNYTVATVTATSITVSETTITTESAAAAGTVTVTRTNYNALPQNNSLTLARGLVVLDQTMYVLDTQGTVWGSNVANSQDWDDALNYITAEKEEDAGVAIEKHYNNLVVFGRRTIEFMYDNANPTGSPLSVRGDISYNIGCADPHSIWRNGDDIYFLGIDTTGMIQPYVLSEFRLIPISDSDLSAFFTTTKSIDGILTYGSGCSAGGEAYYILTIYQLDDSSNPVTSATYVYNSLSKIWSEWEYAGSDVDNFPVVGYTITDDSRIGEGILSTGELVYLLDNFTPYDSIGTSTDPYVTSGYVGSDYVLAGTNATSTPMTLTVRLDNWDNGNRDWKYFHQLRFVGDSTQDSNTLTVNWNDDNNIPDTYTHSNTIDLQKSTNKITRLGRSKSRSFELSYAGTEQIRMEGIDVDISEGTH